jgi:hypothetical protein
MTRNCNWQSALSDYIVKCAQTPFQYGVLDCGLFIAGSIEAMTGVDVSEELRGKYSNRRNAFAAIRKMCGTATVEAIAAHFAAKCDIAEVPVSFAHRGDPVVLRHGRTSSLGIVDMSQGFLLTPYKDGLLRLPIDCATKAYHIG